MNRRDFLTKTASGLSGLILGSNVLTPTEAEALRVKEYKGKQELGEMTVRPYKKEGFGTGNEKFNTVISATEKLEGYDYSNPTIYYGNKKTDFRLKANASDKKGLYLKIPGHSELGFRGRHNVEIDIEEGAIKILKDKTRNGPIIELIDAEADITSGSNILGITYKESDNIEENANTGRLRGSTPLIVRPHQSMFEYHFHRRGGITKHRNPAFQRY